MREMSSSSSASRDDAEDDADEDARGRDARPRRRRARSARTARSARAVRDDIDDIERQSATPRNDRPKMTSRALVRETTRASARERLPRRTSTARRLTRARSTDASSDERTAFIFGLGYLGGAVAREFARDGYVVRGTHRASDAPGASTLDVVSRAYEWDGEGACEAIEREVRAATRVVSCVPPTRGTGTDGWRDPVYDAFARAVTSSVDEDGGGTRFFGYASSTSVYGDHGGEIVDETSACRPRSAKARARFEGEERWRALARESNGRVTMTTFRLGGIYGPGRSALDVVLRRARGERESESQRARRTRRFTSRVHVDDAARNRRMKETLATFGDGASMLYPSVYHGLLRIAASRGILASRASEDEFNAWFDERFDALFDGEYARVALEELRS